MSDHHRPVLAAGLASSSQPSRPRRAVVAGLFALAIVGSFSLPSMLGAGVDALALPLNIRAKARVELDHRRRPDGLELHGRLIDDRGEPIAEERVSIALGGREPETLATDRSGRFAVKLDRRTVSSLERAHGISVPWTVRFPGSRLFGETVSDGIIDLSRRSSRLTLTLATEGLEQPQTIEAAPERGAPNALRVPMSDTPMTLTVSLEDALAKTPIAESEVRIRVGEGSELVGATGSSGRATFVLRPDLLEAGGRYRIVARFAGDPVYVPSLAEIDLEVLLPTRLTLRVVREGNERDGRYRFSGRLADQNGPLRQAIIAIEGFRADSTGAPLSPEIAAFVRVQASDENGLFVAAINATELHEKKLRRLLVQATFRPALSSHSASRSHPVLLEIPLPAGIPLRWYAAALGALLLFVGLARALKNGSLARIWRALVDRMKRLRRLKNILKSKTSTIAADASDIDPSFVLPDSKRSASSLRGDHIAGRIVDATDGRGLAATISARNGQTVSTTTTDSDGRFELGPLAPGASLIAFESVGYLPRELALPLPHDGAYDGARFSLVAVKKKLRDIFGETVGGLGVDLAWGQKTPRETMEKALGARADRPLVEPPLGEMTSLVERAHFARLPPQPDDVERARALQRQVEPEQAPREPR